MYPINIGYKKMYLNKNSISIIIPSINPKTWPQLIKNYYSKKVQVEIIFLSPANYNLSLPKNVKFIKTDFKVNQCLEIGLRSSSNYYSFQSADDISLKGSEDPLADMVYAANSFPNNLICIKYAINGKKVSRNETNLVSNHPKTLIPLAGVISKKMINEVGGYNKNYIASYGDIDLYLRIKNAGYKYRWLDIYMDEYRPKGSSLGQLSFRYLGHDIKYLKYNWLKYNSKNKIFILRNQPLENFKPFNKNNLLQIEQGRGINIIFKLKLFRILMKYKIFRYGALIIYKVYRKYILKSNFY